MTELEGGSMAKIIDLTYQTFGMLTAVERAGARNREALWRCICNCGKETLVASRNLRKGLTKSCGCLRKQHMASLATGRVTHGRTKSRLYNAVYRGMMDSCYSPSRKSFRNLSSRGITVCDEWRKDFQAFYDWAMANGYDENAPRGQSVVYRVDKSEGFSPENCKVGTIAESMACKAARGKRGAQACEKEE